MSAYEDGMRAARHTGRGTVAVVTADADDLAHRTVEAFLAEQPVAEACATHNAPWYDDTCLWTETYYRASYFKECRKVPARLVVTP